MKYLAPLFSFLAAAAIARAADTDTNLTVAPGKSVQMTWDYQDNKPPANCEFVIAEVVPIVVGGNGETVLVRTAGYPSYTLPPLAVGPHTLVVYVKENVDPFRRSGYSNTVTVTVTAAPTPTPTPTAQPTAWPAIPGNFRGKASP